MREKREIDLSMPRFGCASPNRRWAIARRCNCSPQSPFAPVRWHTRGREILYGAPNLVAAVLELVFIATALKVISGFPG